MTALVESMTRSMLRCGSDAGQFSYVVAATKLFLARRLVALARESRS